MTQEQFAEMLEMSVDFLSLMERGVSAPSFETLERMAKRLRVPVAELFTFESKCRLIGKNWLDWTRNEVRMKAERQGRNRG